MESITLQNTTGTRNAEYQLHIKSVDDGFIVSYLNGRIGSTLTGKNLTANPVDLQTAKKLFTKKIKAKLKGGYKEIGSDTSAYTMLVNNGVHSGIDPQQPNSINASEAIKLCQNDDFVLQEKINGQRKMVDYTSDKPQGINKRGMYVAIPTPIAEAYKNTDSIIDGESIGDTLYAFDAVRIEGVDITTLSFAERYKRLSLFLDKQPNKHIVRVPVYFTTDEKLQALNEFQKNSREGVVFRDQYSPYTGGRPHTGGTQLKHKFYKTCSVIVHEHNLKRSVKMSVLDSNNNIVIVGNVTIPSNKSIPPIHSVIEVRYLNAVVKSNALYEPVYLNERDDVLASECTLNQLEYKPE